MKIVYVPIDERPCNVDVVQRIVGVTDEVTLLTPPDHVYGYKKEAADKFRMREWVHSVKDCDAFVLSADMLCYGGLLPSRLHHMTEADRDTFIEWMRTLRRETEAPLYVATMIMRTPKYSSDDEEPDYYGQFGAEMYRRAWLRDQGERDGLIEEEQGELANLNELIPTEHVVDYETRRAFNRSINEAMIQLVEEGVIERLFIPQDDSAEYGYTSIDQTAVLQHIQERRVFTKVHMYPGADEVGATMVARAFLDRRGTAPRVYPIWSSVLGPTLIPMYEDRPFIESMYAHLDAIGLKIAERMEDADLMLAYNVPGRAMQESWDQDERDVTYTSFRHMRQFVTRIEAALTGGKRVIVADSAYANGGDQELIMWLDELNLLERLDSYKGWNTNGNTLGTTLAQGVFAQVGKNERIRENVLYHVLDDFVYQAKIRMKMTDTVLPEYGANYFDLNGHAETISKERDRMMTEVARHVLRTSFHETWTVNTSAPWNRMFECRLEFGGTNE
ncbi:MULTISPECIES: DUF4127 family protein [unclassified Exiguobacterium]|uniref:DUF4127 family protein n=1 Tax=unclassified Exiguobacterium TaxID=2644629 RepID=UPI001BE958FE|nr:MULTISPECIES: DUF4127 family protein [unclassified Exiguobacterium]